MKKKPEYPTPDNSTPTVDLLDMIDDSLRNGSAPTRANLCFDLLCERLGHDRDQFPTFRAWREEDKREERRHERMHADCTQGACIVGRENDCPHVNHATRLSELFGKTVAAVVERDMAGYDTYKELVTWTSTVITFTDGCEITLGGADTEVYDAFEYDGLDMDNQPIPKEKP